ncbi:MAG: hypothetical protein ACU85V_16300 [Gammaproteobacteria bacterium]
MARLRVVVSGLLVQYPLGGMTWHYLQYIAGLRALGHEVFYLEDTGQYPFDPVSGGLTNDPTRNLAYLVGVFEALADGVAWAYRFPWESTWYGAGEAAARRALREADVILNVSGVLQKPGAWARDGVLALIDTDPVFTQIKLLQGRRDFVSAVDAHDRHFTFGETLPATLAATGHAWLPTRQPVLLDLWRTDVPPGRRYTTIMNWTSYKPVQFDGATFGQKDVELERLLDLPADLAPGLLELAVNDGKTRRTPVDRLRRQGWQVEHPDAVCGDWDAYRDYVQGSRGEFSVAKNGYVQGRCGWFSERSACYLAAGRPVVTQDTGFSGVLPTGEGLLAYTDRGEAARCLQQVEADYARHARAARSLAADYFDAARVLGALLEAC